MWKLPFSACMCIGIKFFSDHTEVSFYVKFGGLIPESTQGTTAVAFPTKPETFYFNDVLKN